MNVDQADLSPRELDEAIDDPDLFNMDADRNVSISDLASVQSQDQSLEPIYVDAS